LEATLKLSKRSVVLVGLLTLLPLAYMVFFFVWIFVSFFADFATSSHGKSPVPDAFAYILVLHLGAMLLTVGLTIFYIVHLFKSTVVPNDQKALWAVVLFLGNMIAMPIYWYLQMWREVSPRALESPSVSTDG
jgi:hypothetical protein